MKINLAFSQITNDNTVGQKNSFFISPKYNNTFLEDFFMLNILLTEFA